MWLTITALAGFILAINASFACDFVRVDLSQAASDNGLGNVGDVGFGLLTYESPISEDTSGYNACIEWDRNREAKNYFSDGFWKAARAFAIMGNIGSGIGMVAAVLMCCMAFGREARVILAFCLLWASVCEVLTFLIFASDTCELYDCVFSMGGGLAIAACIMCFISAVLMSKLPSENEDFLPGTSAAGAKFPSASANGTTTVEELGKCPRECYEKDSTKLLTNNREQWSLMEPRRL
jgi:hypothetical protein